MQNLVKFSHTFFAQKFLSAQNTSQRPLAANANVQFLQAWPEKIDCL